MDNKLTKEQMFDIVVESKEVEEKAIDEVHSADITQEMVEYAKEWITNSILEDIAKGKDSIENYEKLETSYSYAINGQTQDIHADKETIMREMMECAEEDAYTHNEYILTIKRSDGVVYNMVEVMVDKNDKIKYTNREAL